MSEDNEFDAITAGFKEEFEQSDRERELKRREAISLLNKEGVGKAIMFRKSVAITIADISTGHFATTEIVTDTKEEIIRNEIARIHPKECILPENLYNDPAVLAILKSEKEMNIFPYADWDIYASDATKVLKKHFGIATLAGFDLENKELAQQTSAVLLGYLQETQKGPVQHIKKIATYTTHDYLLLDKSTVLNLELFTTIREQSVHFA